jgi:YbbR domain-containing protein
MENKRKYNFQKIGLICWMIINTCLLIAILMFLYVNTSRAKAFQSVDCNSYSGARIGQLPVICADNYGISK